MEILEKLSCATEKSTDKINWAVLRIISVAAIAAAAEGIRCDYGSEGILYIAAFYLCRKNRIYQILLFLFAYIVMTGNQPSACLLLACLIILLYNGKRGKLKLKYFFYVFYPAHIMLFYLTTLGLEKFWQNNVYGTTQKSLQAKAFRTFSRFSGGRFFRCLDGAARRIIPNTHEYAPELKKRLIQQALT